MALKLIAAAKAHKGNRRARGGLQPGPVTRACFDRNGVGDPPFPEVRAWQASLPCRRLRRRSLPREVRRRTQGPPTEPAAYAEYRQRRGQSRPPIQERSVVTGAIVRLDVALVDQRVRRRRAGIGDEVQQAAQPADGVGRRLGAQGLQRANEEGTVGHVVLVGAWRAGKVCAPRSPGTLRACPQRAAPTARRPTMP